MFLCSIREGEMEGCDHKEYEEARTVEVWCTEDWADKQGFVLNSVSWSSGFEDVNRQAPFTIS